MKKIILYIAASLDGYIATTDHSIAWLNELENPEGNDYGYHDFISSVDVLVMGRKTYDIVRGFDMEWPYKDQKSYILTSKKELSPDTPNTEALSGDLKENLNRLKATGGQKDIWLVGGGQTILALLKQQAIDEIMLFTAPILLGSGIPLFPESTEHYALQLLESRPYDTGMLYCHYKVDYS